MILRFVEHRTARAGARAWLGSAVADAREPKLLSDATRLAPTALPRAPALPPAPAPVPPRSGVAPLVVAEPEPEPVDDDSEPVQLAGTFGMEEAMAWMAEQRERSRREAAGEDMPAEVVAAPAPPPKPPAPPVAEPDRRARAARIVEGAAPRPQRRLGRKPPEPERPAGPDSAALPTPAEDPAWRERTTASQPEDIAAVTAAPATRPPSSATPPPARSPSASWRRSSTGSAASSIRSSRS